jgi:hypothetical protein
MANTHTQICLHRVFALEGGQNLIPAGHKGKRACWKGSALLTTGDAFSKLVKKDGG